MHEKLINGSMEFMLRGENKVIEKLRMQFQESIIVEVRDTKVGMYARFEVINKTLRIDDDEIKKDFAFGDVNGIIEDKESIGFILYVKNGYIEWLEGYSLLDNVWELADECNEFVYTGGQRILRTLEKDWKNI